MSLWLPPVKNTLPSLTALTLFHPAVYSAVGVASGATFVPAVTGSPWTVTSVCDVFSPSSAVRRSTYWPLSEKRAVVEAAAASSKSTVAPSGALTTLQVDDNVPEGSPSSLTVPTKAAAPPTDAWRFCHAVTSGASFVDAGAATPVRNTCSSLTPVLNPLAWVTVKRTASPVTSGNCTWL